MKQNLQINPERLWDEIIETGKIGGTAKGGVNRLTLTDLDRQVRDWFKAKAESLGCMVTIDDMGAMFARRPGQRDDMPPIAMGSHLDTQPTGGKFDGVLGVLGALEALRTLHVAGFETFAPIEVVNWTNEEGARFAPAMVSSGVFAGAFAHDWASSRKDPDGITFAEALEKIGYRGPQKCGEHPLSAFFELHIEQGPLLEAEGKEIGVVTGIQGIRWFEVTITGQDAHSGTTPMPRRRNALLGAMQIVEQVNAMALQHAPLAVGTVGFMQVRPNSPNVVPGEVFFTVDLRHPEAKTLDAMEAALKAAIASACKPQNLESKLSKILDQPPVHFNPECIDCVREAAKNSGFSMRDIVSGAGHDAGYVSRVAPASMIFAPCHNGVSHNEAEFTSKEQCAAGAQVLLQAVLNYDRRLAERHGKR
ncbi:MAG TPA: Zn-dependent hydrolase [Xanthobacteraceae bacterium]|nr:Zn-dependent hydrolase [Xanthobacteraceae bacterium]